MKILGIIVLLFISCRICLAQDVDRERVIRIPVIFHVIHSDKNHAERTDGGNTSENLQKGLLLAELQDLHRDFLLLNIDTAQIIAPFKGIIGKANIDFYLADTVLQDHGEKGTIRINSNSNKNRLYKRSKVIDPKKYLNVYIGNIGGSYAPGSSWLDPERDAVYLAFDWVGLKYRLLTHEVGHWCGLFHIYGGDGGAKGNSKSCTIGDMVDDTPPQYEATELDAACETCPPPIGKAVDKSCDKSKPSNFNNFMDYSGCRKMFTVGQAVRIREILKANRKEIWNSIH